MPAPCYFGYDTFIIYFKIGESEPPALFFLLRIALAIQEVFGLI
jgi:hypothetical protein